MNTKTHEEIWASCLNYIKGQISEKSFNTWFLPIRSLALEGHTLVIQVPSPFFYEWLETHFLHWIRLAIQQELGEKGALEYDIIVDSNLVTAQAPKTVHYKSQTTVIGQNSATTHYGNQTPAQHLVHPYIAPGIRKEPIRSNLNLNYSFNNFIEGECNRLARSAGYAVARNPGKTSFNPLLIYGNVGLGKTHLAQAIGIETKILHPEKNVLFVSSEQFLSQYMQACKKDETGQNKLNNFVHFYQMIDLLIVDDIQTWEQKNGIQQIFFQIFNFLHQNGKQIILTSDKAPIQMRGIEDRLLSRFKWGLSADLQAPDIHTKLEILQKKALADGIEMPLEILEYIAMHVSSNVRELEGAVISIMAQSSLNKKPITLELVKEMLSRFTKNTVKEISFDSILRVVSNYFKVDSELITGKTRKREVTQCRQLVMFFCKKYTNLALAAIGSHCGNRDHATVLHALKVIEDLLSIDKKFKIQVEEIEKSLK